MADGDPEAPTGTGSLDRGEVHAVAREILVGRLRSLPDTATAAEAALCLGLSPERYADAVERSRSAVARDAEIIRAAERIVYGPGLAAGTPRTLREWLLLEAFVAFLLMVIVMAIVVSR
jgi:hypothetical protein